MILDPFDFDTSTVRGWGCQTKEKREAERITGTQIFMLWRRNSLQDDKNNHLRRRKVIII